MKMSVVIHLKFEHVFQEGEELILREVKVGVPFAPLESVNIGLDSQEVLYLDNFVSVGLIAMHRFIQRGDEGDSIDYFTIQDGGIEGVVDGTVIAKTGFGYSNGTYSLKGDNPRIPGLGETRIRALELLRLAGR